VFSSPTQPLLNGWQTASRLRELEREGSDLAESGQSREDGTTTKASACECTTAAAAVATCTRHRLPVIVCTANETTDAHGRQTHAASSALSAGADVVLTKPMTLAGLQVRQ
jgi:CheY-like chemotaxis protein